MHCTLFALVMLILGGCGIAPAPQIYVSSAYIPGADINNLYSQAKYNQPSDKTHRIEKGENLYSISKKYGISLRDLLQVNDIAPPYTVYVGDILKLPNLRLYKVVKGDTISAIANKFGISMREIVVQNKISPPYIIYQGSILKIPSQKFMRNANNVRDAKVENKPIKKTLSFFDRRSPSLPPQLSPSGKKNYNLNKAKQTVTMVAPPRKSNLFLRPLQGKIISSFGAKGNGLHNDGINMSAAKGTPILAAENGVVAYKGRQLKGLGNLALIRHADGYVTAYAHADEIIVNRGEIVKRGQIIGYVGSSGNVDVAQLHFEIRQGTKILNPLDHIES